jgi:hypothetical protein
MDASSVQLQLHTGLKPIEAPNEEFFGKQAAKKGLLLVEAPHVCEVTTCKQAKQGNCN